MSHLMTNSNENEIAKPRHLAAEVVYGKPRGFICAHMCSIIRTVSGVALSGFY